MSLWARTIYYFLEAVSYLLIARVLLSWIPQLRGTKFYELLFRVTEPLILPVRNLLSRTRLGNMPFDISVIVVYLLIMLLQILITSI